MGKDKGAASSGAGAKPQPSLLGFLQRKQPPQPSQQQAAKPQEEQQQEGAGQQTPPQGQGDGGGPANGACARVMRYTYSAWCPHIHT